jgi:SAM-dependent methyltransferase
MNIVHNIYQVIGGFFRQKRQRWFKSEFHGCRTVIDVGGTVESLRNHGFAEQVTLLNVGTPPKDLPSTIAYIQGDGRSTGLPDWAFDVAFSNSVIEHVGSFADQQRFASELLRIGRRIYCQTPNKWFPIEPHFLGLCVHWLPRKWFTNFVDRYFTLHGWRYRPDAATSAALIDSIRLLTRAELRQLFPGCKIKTEWWLGLPKSFVVWK